MSIDTKPLAIEPYDKEWGVGVSGLTEEPSPFPRINRLLKWLKNLDSTADAQRALIFTECYEKICCLPTEYKDSPYPQRAI
jgi:formate C-acetyltransferase